MKTVIVATSFNVAHFAADKLGLGPREWRLANRVRDIQGLERGSEVVLALPELNPTREYFELRQLMAARQITTREVHT